MADLSLKQYLQEASTLVFNWGEHDCCRFALKWVKLRRGVDPGAEWLGGYTTARGAERHIRRGGGLLSLCKTAMARAGLRQTDAPNLGDVGVVLTDQGEALAIRSGSKWACAAPQGIVVSPFRTLAAWRV